MAWRRGLRQRRWRQEAVLLWEVWLAVAGAELEAWAASAGGVGTERKGQVGAAWGAAWATEPEVSLQGVLRAGGPREEGLWEGDLRERAEQSEN